MSQTEKEEIIIKKLQEKLRGRPKKAVTEKVIDIKPLKEKVVKERKKRAVTEENKKEKVAKEKVVKEKIVKTKKIKEIKTKKTNTKKIVKKLDKLDQLKIDYESNKCHLSENKYNKTCNTILQDTENLEKEYLEEHPNENSNLYPTLNDPNFNLKIAEKKEFQDTKYDGTIYDIKKQSDILSNAPYELAPYQIFVKNFLSFQTPYNSLLLYNGV